MISYDYIGYIPSLSANQVFKSIVNHKFTVDFLIHTTIYTICRRNLITYKAVGIIENHFGSVENQWG